MGKLRGSWAQDEPCDGYQSGGPAPAVWTDFGKEMKMTDNDHFRSMWLRIVEAFDKDATANQFLRKDGDGGFAGGIYRMAREIERLRDKCGEPQERPADWEAVEDAEIDAMPIAPAP